jgi:ribose-phosphate pyrophosphokinase
MVLTEHDFVATKQPHLENGRVMYDHAPELTWEAGSRIWQERPSIDRRKSQIYVLSANGEGIGHNLIEMLQDEPLNDLPIGTVHEELFPNGEPNIHFANELTGVQSTYLVSNITTPADLLRVLAVADHCKNTLGMEEVNLVTPFLGFTRQDKNGKVVEGSAVYEATPLNIRAVMGALAGTVDSIMAIEPHSSATQALGAQKGVPVLPITPWPYMVHELEKGIDISRDRKKPDITFPEQGSSCWIGPDKGRNLAAKRSAEALGLPLVSFNKVRISGTDVFLYELSDEEIQAVQGKICYIYDDVGASMGTMDRICKALEKYGAEGAIAMLVHGEFTHGWKERLDNPFLKKILVANTRPPIGNIKLLKEVSKFQHVDLAQLIRGLIQDDMSGINPWQNEDSSRMILQERPDEFR